MSLNSIPYPLTYHCISVILWRLRYARNQTAAWDHILTHRRGNTLKVVIVWHMIIRLPVSADASLRSCVRAMTPIYREPNGVTRLRPFLPPTASYPSPVMGKQCQDQFLHGRVKLLSNFLSNHGSIVLKKLPLSFIVCYGCLSLSLSLLCQWKGHVSAYLSAGDVSFNISSRSLSLLALRNLLFT